MGPVCVDQTYSKLKADVEQKYKDNEDRKWSEDTAKAILVSYQNVQKMKMISILLLNYNFSII